MKFSVRFSLLLIGISIFIAASLIHCGDDDDDDDGDSFLEEYCVAYVEKAYDCETEWSDDNYANIPQVSDWVPNCVSHMRWWDSEHMTCLDGCLGETICEVWEECADDCWGEWDFDEYDEATWIDTATGLKWQTQHTGEADWQTANANCEALELDGHDNWRLPTIDELRSLVRGCSLTEPGGACGVTDSCNNQDTCETDSCNGYLSLEGPSAKGFYMPDVFPINCEPDDGLVCAHWWSLTEVEWYVPEDDPYRWFMDFLHAGLGNDQELNEQSYHCVREAN
jgi:Protein of unknown function (DUF1566)